MMMRGMVTSAPAGMVAAEGYSKAEGPEKRAMATVTGSVGVVDNCRASMNSFHVVMKAMMAVVKSAGAARGRRMSRKACDFVAPSTRAASSNSQGSWRKKLTKV